MDRHTLKDAGHQKMADLANRAFAAAWKAEIEKSLAQDAVRHSAIAEARADKKAIVDAALAIESAKNAQKATRETVAALSAQISALKMMAVKENTWRAWDKKMREVDSEWADLRRGLGVGEVSAWDDFMDREVEMIRKAKRKAEKKDKDIDDFIAYMITTVITAFKEGEQNEKSN
jgi:flagellar biosynthesis chaperone FliJ